MSKNNFPPATPLTPKKRAILIGASSGIGAALAKKLAKEGYTLALIARRKDLLKTLCDEINQTAGQAQAAFYPHDVTDFQSAPALFQKIVRELGGLDLIIYNSGILQKVELAEFNTEKDMAMTQTNYLGAVAWLNPAAEYFHHLGEGQIVGIGSVAGDRGRVGAPAYNASKAALHTYLEALRNRLTRRGVNVLTIKPGFVATEILKNSPRTFMVLSTEQAANGIYQAIRARRQTAYVPPLWGLIMLIIRHIPSIIFRRMSF